MLRYLTAGESHGRQLTAILDGMPSNLKLDIGRIGEMLRLRKKGYGRGGRQNIESDALTIASGVRNGVTTGCPITLVIENRDYANWEPYMDALSCDTSGRTVTAVRPGHADLTGSLKYGHSDARNVLERASARETAIRVAVGAVCRELLFALGVRTAGYVYNIGGVADDAVYSFDEVYERAGRSAMRVMDEAVERAMIRRIDEAKACGNTVGGRVRVMISGVKPGLGDFTQYDKKLDAAVAAALMSIQAVKGVEVGLGFGFSEKLGGEVMDAILPAEGGFRRATNRAGGIEGGMSNGEVLVFSAVMKPIPTLAAPLDTVDLVTRQPVKAAFERSDVCAVPACSVVAECAAAFEVAKAVLAAVPHRDFTEIEKVWKRSACL